MATNSDSDSWHKHAIDVLIKSSIHLRLHTDSICTACRYLHRYKDFLDENPKTIQQEQEPESSNDNNYDVGVVVSTALYIATKTKENHVQLSQLISSVHFHLQNYGQEEEMINYDSYKLLPKDVNYWKLRDSVTCFEMLLLRILQFDLIIDLPHKYLIFYLKSLSDWIDDEPLVEQLFLMSWSILNDYFCYHPEALKWKPNHVALAAIDLAIETIAPKIKDIIENKQTGLCWYANFDPKLKKHSMKQLIHQMTDVYRQQQQQTKINASSNDKHENSNSHLKLQTDQVMEKHEVKSHH